MPLVIALLALLAAGPQTITGIILDSSGAAVPNAVVLVRPDAAGGRGEQRTLSGPDGRFSVEVPAEGAVTVTVRAGGFAEQMRRLTAEERTAEVTIMLQPAPLLETVTVTPARVESPAGQVPASVNVLTAADIKASPAVVADDVLRELPTFSLFRRSSSLSSHPTTQGVSLRGLGPSGVSRTLVLSDGAPINDPFGGWVHWTMVPLDGVGRIEVVDSSSASLYGNYAMGGVINIVGIQPVRRTIELTPQYGNRQSPKFDLFGSDVWGKVGLTLAGTAFDTDGFPVVAADERGPIDNNATVKFGTLDAKLDYAPTSRVSGFLKGSVFSETRGNGKIQEGNDTRLTMASGGIRVQLPGASELEGHLFSTVERFHSTFFAVTPPSATVPARSLERLTLDQRVPTTSVGGTVQWTRPVGSRHVVGIGGDWQWVDGESREGVYFPAAGPVIPPVQDTVLSLNRISGGTQRSAAAFAQDTYAATSRVTITVGARLDHWRNYNAHNLETSVPSGAPTANNQLLPSSQDTVVSPRVAAAVHASDRVTLWGSLGSGFRAPTLNELYRQFRVGTVLTLANAQLGPERLVGGELGVNVQPVSNLTFRASWFDNRVSNPVSNVTIGTSGSTITQQRQNLGKTGIWGLQTEVDYRMGSLRIKGAYLYDHATVLAFAADPGLVGNFIPQVPKHRATAEVSYANPRFASAALDIQLVGRQFDDDQNIRTVPGETSPGLPGYAVADVTVSRTVAPGVEAFFGVQNLFNTTYIVGTLPTTIGSPRLVDVGVRIRVTGR